MKEKTAYQKESERAFENLLRRRKDRIVEEQRISHQIELSEQNYLRELAFGYRDEVLDKKEMDEAYKDAS